MSTTACFRGGGLVLVVVVVRKGGGGGGQRKVHTLKISAMARFQGVWRCWTWCGNIGRGVVTRWPCLLMCQSFFMRAVWWAVVEDGGGSAEAVGSSRRGWWLMASVDVKPNRVRIGICSIYFLYLQSLVGVVVLPKIFGT